MNPCEDCITWPICKIKVINILRSVTSLTPSPTGMVHATLYKDCSIFKGLSEQMPEVGDRVNLTRKVIDYAKGNKYYTVY